MSDPTIFNIFPTTIYSNEVENHDVNKKLFFDLYPKYDYEENERSVTVSEGQVDPLIHLEPTMYPVFGEIVRHIKHYVLDILKFKDMFNYAITKSWISRARDKSNIPYHIHSTSHVSFVYYLHIPPKSHYTVFLNRENMNSLFLGSNSENNIDDLNMMQEFNNENCKTFFLEPREGTLLVFPSNLSHGTRYVDKNFKGERLALVGDVNLILKEEHLLHSMGLIDEKFWKKYE